MIVKPLSVRDRGLFTAIYQSEALWISFRNAKAPTAIRIFTGGVNGLSGRVDLRVDAEELGKEEQNVGLGATQDYLVAPGQPWLDGFVTSDGEVRYAWVRIYQFRNIYCCPHEDNL